MLSQGDCYAQVVLHPRIKRWELKARPYSVYVLLSALAKASHPVYQKDRCRSLELKISQLTALERRHRLYIYQCLPRVLPLLALTFHIFSCSFSGFCRRLPPLPGGTRRWVLSLKHFVALSSVPGYSPLTGLLGRSPASGCYLPEYKVVPRGIPAGCVPTRCTVTAASRDTHDQALRCPPGGGRETTLGGFSAKHEAILQ